MGLSERRRSSVGRDAAIYLVASVVQRALPVAVLPILTRIISASEVGTVALALAVSNLGSILLSLGLQFSIVRLVHDDPVAGRTKAWPSLVWWQLAFAVVAAVALLVLGPLWAPFLFPRSGWSPVLAFSIVLGASMSVQSTLVALARTRLRVGVFIVVTILQAVVGQGSGLALSASFGALGYVVGMGLGSSAAVLVGLLLLRVPFQFKVYEKRIVFSFSGWFIIHLIGGWALNLSDRLIIERFLGSEVLSSYYLAYVVGTGLLLVLDAAQSAWVPRFFALKDVGRKRRLLSDWLLVATIASSSVALMVGLLMPVALDVLSPNIASWAVPAGVVITASAVFRPAYLLAVAAMNDGKNAVTQGLSSICVGGATVVLNIALIPLCGVFVAVATSVIAVAVQALWCLIAARRYVNLRSALVLRLLVVWLVAVSVLILVAFIPDVFYWNLFRIVAAGVVGLLIGRAVLLLRRRLM